MSVSPRKATTSISSLKSLSFSNRRGRLTSQCMPLCLRVSCAKQLALPEDSAITSESKFAVLGADSLDTWNGFLFLFSCASVRKRIDFLDSFVEGGQTFETRNLKPHCILAIMVMVVIQWV
ncbi:hypothetical protein AAG906_020730 [Vitis piasezkii]